MPQGHVYKRIIVCCDGTWMDSDGSLQTPSNVTRICRCLKQEGIDKEKNVVPQILYYQSGVGTSNWWDRFVGGGTGAGLAEHIREAYSFVCNNYSPGDEIFIIGFSRGAFTARSVASLIRCIGLLTDMGLLHFYPIFEDWEYQSKAGWKTRYPDQPWSDRPHLDTDAYRRKLLDLEMTRPNIPIKCVAVWDTVGGLGIPMIAILPQTKVEEFNFVDTKVEPNIEYAFQALALDEHRRSFTPTIWEKPDGQALPKVLKQTWFPGVHSDIGGSYDDADLANITLAWMVSQLDPFLTFDRTYLVHENRVSMERHVADGSPPREWGLGLIHNSMTLFFKLGGSAVRTPKEYFAATDAGGQWWHSVYRWVKTVFAYITFSAPPSVPAKRLQNTNEHFHSSVRIRMGKKGMGYNDRGLYDSQALKGWVMYGVEASAGSAEVPGPAGKMKSVKWVKRLPGDKMTSQVEMVEDEIGDVERLVMKAWPEIYDDFYAIKPGSHPANIKHASTFPTMNPQTDDPTAAKGDGGASGDPAAAGANWVDLKHPERTGTI